MASFPSAPDSSNDEALLLLTEQYVDDTLPPAERAAFEARLLVDEAARAAVAAHQQLVADIRAAGRAELLGRLTRLETALANEDAGSQPELPALARRAPAATMRVSSVRRPPLARWVIAAAATVVLATGTWWVLRGPNPQALADQYGLADPGLPVLMSEPTDGVRARTQVNEAMNAYKLADYRQALALWEKLPANSVGPDTLTYYRGIFLLRAHRPTDAARELARVRQSQASALKDRAEYYEALALWAGNQPEAARQLFARLAARADHPFAQAARDVLPHVR